MDEDFSQKLINAKSVEEFISIIDDAETAKDNARTGGAGAGYHRAVRGGGRGDRRAAGLLDDADAAAVRHGAGRRDWLC